MSPSDHIVIRLRARPDETDTAIALLAELGTEGFLEDGNEVEWWVASDVATEAWLQAARIRVRELFDAKILEEPTFILQKVADQNWNQEWEKSIEPVEVSAHIAIAPSWKIYEGSCDIVITIDPKMSFGTGHHETTRLMIRILENLHVKNSSVLDLGTGSGVLAIAAARLGAESVEGVELDAGAVANAEENVKANTVEHIVKLRCENILTTPLTGFYNIILANLHRNLLTTLFPGLRKHLSSGGALVISGILTVDEEEIKQAAIKEKFIVRETLREGEWSAIHLQ